MDNLKELFYEDRFWEETFNKLSLKPNLSKQDKELLWKLKEIYKNSIIEQLFNGEYEWSTPEKVLIAKSSSNKKRTIYVYNIRDRYIIGVMYRVFSDYYRDRISDLCFSYKKGTSTNDAITYLKNNNIQSKKYINNYGLKIDIHAYFNSVSKEKVQSMLDELFSSGIKETLNKLMLNNTVNYKGQLIQEWKSLIPGCALGSFFANYCLKELDEQFDENNKIYARYSDDIILIENNKKELENDLEIIKKYISKYGLEINPNKYTWFEPGDSVEYLGLKLCSNGDIDISEHSKQKIKKNIHRWCRKGRMEIERYNKSFNSVARSIIRRINNKNMFCIIDNKTTFGWCHYSFRYITTIESLKEIDFYTRDTIRAMKTGKHNKNNVKAIDNEEFKNLGLVSLVDMYMLYKKDFDYYMEVIELMKNT